MQDRWYEISVSMDDEGPGNVVHQDLRNGMYVGPHTRPAGYPGAAQIESRELAEAYRTALLPIFERRYGEGVELEVTESVGEIRPKHREKILKHSSIIRARLATGNFAPNVRVVPLAQDEV